MTKVVLTGLAAGGLLALSLPPWGFWPLAVGGIVLLDRLIADQPVAARFRRGFLVGLALLGPSMSWMKDVTVPGYLVAVALYGAMIGGAAAACPPGPWRRLALPGAWLLSEAWRISWPFGGVPLSTLALGQVEGPLAPVAGLGGVLAVGAAVVALGVAVSAAIDRHWRPAGVGAVAVALILAVSAAAPDGRDTGARLSAALVQGGGPQGTRDEDVDDRVVFEHHLEASAAVPQGVDLTLWPEDVVDTDGYVVDAAEGDDLAALAQRLDTTLIAGVVETEDDESFHNASMVWDSSGTVVDRYEKVQRVPFGEWVPFRGLLEPIAGDALPRRDAIVGVGPAVVVTPQGTLGVAISWEVFFGHRVRDGVLHGARALINPTNGASYTGTIVQSQQVASSQLRAVETGRWVAQIAPTGFTAFITPDGRVLQRTGVSERAVRVHDLVLRTGLTPYTRLGDRPFIALGAALVGGAWLARVRRRATRSDLEEEGDGAVVHQLDGHVGTEATSGHGGAEVAKGVDDGIDERLGHRRRGGPGP